MFQGGQLPLNIRTEVGAGTHHVFLGCASANIGGVVTRRSSSWGDIIDQIQHVDMVAVVFSCLQRFDCAQKCVANIGGGTSHYITEQCAWQLWVLTYYISLTDCDLLQR